MIHLMDWIECQLAKRRRRRELHLQRTNWLRLMVGIIGMLVMLVSMWLVVLSGPRP